MFSVMATMNPFDLLGDDAEDPSVLIAAEQNKVVVAAPKKAAAAQDQGKPGARPQALQQNKAAQLPTKPPPPAQAGELLIPLYFVEKLGFIAVV